MTEKQIETFALSWHSWLFLGHVTAVAYNLVRGKRKWAAIHSVMAAVEGKAVINHILEPNGSLR